jgi:PAT family acetyl-CoA transporter-like MFS transporter 1
VPSAKWGLPVLSLSGYLQFWAVICIGVSFGLLLFKTEVGIKRSSALSALISGFQDPEVIDENELNTAAVYKTIWDICKLKRARSSRFRVCILTGPI